MKWENLRLSSCYFVSIYSKNAFVGRFEMFHLFIQVQIFHTPNGNPYLQYIWCQSIDGHFFSPHSMYYKVWIWIMCEKNPIRWKSTVFSKSKSKITEGICIKAASQEKVFISNREAEQSMKFSFFFLLQIFQVRNKFVSKLQMDICEINL